VYQVSTISVCQRGPNGLLSVPARLTVMAEIMWSANAASAHRRMPADREANPANTRVGTNRMYSANTMVAKSQNEAGASTRWNPIPRSSPQRRSRGTARQTRIVVSTSTVPIAAVRTSNALGSTVIPL
jgi:hypothetical protein